ncbi:MAG: chemotaxis protein CheB [Spirochaetota bacterium]
MPGTNKKDKLKKKAGKTRPEAIKAAAEKHDNVFHVVGIGASAGGLETLETFFTNMPDFTGMAFVIIQHLNPKHESIMAAILAKYTKMPVAQIKDGMKIEPDSVYLNPPGCNVAMAGLTFSLSDIRESQLINMPIDFFFRSMASNLGENAICVILSGTATDGTFGIKAVKGAGGMAMVQDPETAKYDGMPKSAIGTGIVDFILPVEQMPEALKRYVKHPLIEKHEPGIIPQSQFETHVQKILNLVRKATGHDFFQYKQTTIRRRIEHRLAVHQLNKLSDYILYIQQNPAELNSLFQDLVINVTEFFRDPEAFDFLKNEALLYMLSAKEPDTPLRIWVVGCSTGEEAYSLAIIISEIMEQLNRYYDVQIFATDIDEKALSTARKGVYPKNISEEISAERLNRFFVKEAGGYKIKKVIRDMLVFSLHNVASDPPFSKLDMISCRNLLIYMDVALQKKIISLFNYSLNRDGLLFLGSSESIGEFNVRFQTLNSSLKIFRQKHGQDEKMKEYQPKKNGHKFFTERSGEETAEHLPDLQAIAEKMLLSEFAPSGVLINGAFEILRFIGDTDKYLVPPKGKATFNILNMARGGLKERLASVIYKANRQKKTATAKEIIIKYAGKQLAADITVLPVTDAGFPGDFLLVVFEDVTFAAVVKEKGAIPGKKRADPATENLKKELSSTREYLQSNIRELQASNEEQRSMNEEMQSVNEEMQSANEELETSKEELQSTNEELVTVNSELQDKVGQLTLINDDMNNLLYATEIASIFLDMNLRIKWFTPAAVKIFNVIQTDIGRPLDDLRANLSDFDITVYARKVLKDLNTVEKIILTKDKVWYSMRITPYRTLENIINGVVMTFFNIQKLRQAENIRRYGALLQDSLDAIIVQNFRGNILAWNKGAELMYGWTEAEALNMNISAIIPEDKKDEINSISVELSKGKTIKPFKSVRTTKEGRIINVWLTATALLDENGSLTEIATTERNLEWLAD